MGKWTVINGDVYLIVVLKNPTKATDVLACYFATEVFVGWPHREFTLVISLLETVLPQTHFIVTKIVVVVVIRFFTFDTARFWFFLARCRCSVLGLSSCFLFSCFLGLTYQKYRFILFNNGTHTVLYYSIL